MTATRLLSNAEIMWEYSATSRTVFGTETHGPHSQFTYVGLCGRHLIMSLREASQYLSCEVDDPMYSFRPDRDGPKPVCTACLTGLCQKLVAAEPDVKEQFNEGKALGGNWSAP